MKRRVLAGVLGAAFLLAALLSIREILRETPTPLEVEARLAEGRALEEKGDLDSAIEEYERAAESDDPLLKARAFNRLAGLHLQMGENERGGSLAEKALDSSRRASDRAQESDALFNLGSLQYSFGRMRDAMKLFEESARSALAASDPKLESRALLYVGLAAGMMEEREAAVESLVRAANLSRESGDGRGEAEAIRVLGQIASQAGDNQKALEHYEEAQRLLKPLGDRATEATILNALGQVYFDMGEKETALRHYLAALELNRALQFRRREAATILEVGRCQLDLGRTDEALGNFESALEIYRELKNQRLEADVLAELGRLRRSRGEQKAALDYFDRALALKTSSSDLAGRAYILDEAGMLHRSLGNRARALRSFQEAAELSREADDPLFEAQALYHVALVNRDEDELAEARAGVERAIALAETIRARVASHGMRTSFFASVHERYSFYVDLLLRLDSKSPGKGFDELAFQAAERARARTLQDSLEEAAADIREGIDPRLLEEERALKKRLNDLAIERQFLTGPESAERLAEMKGRIAEAAEEYDRLQARIRAESPRYAALTEPRASTLSAVSDSLLDGESCLLAYSLGDERSFLWSVRSDGHSVHTLPPAEEIEELAREVHLLLKTPGAWEKAGRADSALERLSGILLTQAGIGGSRRLLVIADGALSYVPFGALSDPETGAPLIESHEIVRLPSSSIVPLMRSLRSGREPAHKVAVLADPVTLAGDPRLPETAKTRSPGVGLRLPPLPESRREASDIASLGPAGSVEVVTGFAASRHWFDTADLRGFRAIHIATHGIVDADEPELSGIVLSLFDESGDAVDGFLRLHDVYNLKLPVDLVVLSACDTALGKEVRGEGLVSLVRGFLYAGASAVIASSWKVDDRATAELMKEFYRRWFEGTPAAAALREAQVSMWRTPRFHAPYYWAAFELQGDWR